MLTFYETPARLKEVPEGLEQMDAEQLRLLVIQGIADGNDPAARSQFLHATDSLRCAQKIYMERKTLYQPVIVRWPLAAAPQSLLPKAAAVTSTRISLYYYKLGELPRRVREGAEGAREHLNGSMHRPRH